MANDDSIYIKHLSYTNTGPIVSLEIDAPFNSGGNPKPIVLVGENGSGKSTVLSNITDSFLEIGGQAFNNVLSQEGLGHQYYKSISSDQIRVGSDYQVARIDFTNGMSYLFKSGSISFEEYSQTHGPVDPSLDWKDEPNQKTTTFGEKSARSFLENQIACCFLSNRYEKPSWMGDSYHRPAHHVSPSVRGRFSGQTANRVLVDECIDETLQWLLDIIVDSRVDIALAPSNEITLAHNPDVNDVLLFGHARSGIEKILSSILGKSVYFEIAPRHHGASRFRIKEVGTNSIVCPSLNSLSTGQIILFELFSTIIRYADNNNINNSIYLDQIKGIVVVDEIDLHLHASLQNDILPKLIKMFPRVQFIFSTHSPLLLLGLERELGSDGYLLAELPTGYITTPESFREFGTAYKAYTSTKKHQEELQSHLKRSASMPLVITEGTTDWRILEKVQEKLQANYPNLFEKEFLYYKFGSKSDDQCEYIHEMGSAKLKNTCATLAAMPETMHGIIIAITDRDEDAILGTMDADPWVDHGNNVFSFAIPVPTFREKSPSISIEQMLTNETMKTSVRCSDGIPRRLYTSEEFDSYGRCLTEGSPYFAKGRINRNGQSRVLDGGNIKLISQDPNSEVNYALSKIEFAKAITSERIQLTPEDLEAFIPLFEKIQKILSSAEKKPS